MSEFFQFTVSRIYKDFAARTDFWDLESAKLYYHRHLADEYMYRIELQGISCTVGVVTILESERLDAPTV